MKTLLLSLVVLAAVPRVARADGWWGGCDENHDGQTDCGGCDSDGNPDNGIQCKCSSSGTDPVAVGSGLGIVGVVAWRIGKKRRNR